MVCGNLFSCGALFTFSLAQLTKELNKSNSSFTASTEAVNHEGLESI